MERSSLPAPGSRSPRRRALPTVALTAALGVLLATPATAHAGGVARPVAQIPERASWTAPAGGAPVTGQLTLPKPSGPRRIGTVTLHLVDKTRTDPWLPSHPTRELMVQLWYPAARAAGHPLAPWISPGAVTHFEKSMGIPARTLRWPTTHARNRAPVLRGRRPRPVVLYSPGLGSERNKSTSLVEELASHGYIVVTIDHTHDAGRVEFPDGRVATTALPVEIDDEVVAKALAVRVADTRFVLDQLTAINTGANPDAAGRPLPRGLRGALDLSRTGMFGHSLGGATALAAMHDDARVRAAANLDGSLLGGSATAGSDRPLLLLGSDQGRWHDPSWDELWANHDGWKRELVLAGSRHISFTDLEVLYPQAAPLVGLTPKQITQVLGPLAPLRAVRAQRVHLRAFFDLHLRGQSTPLFGKASPGFPEIQVVRRGGRTPR